MKVSKGCQISPALANTRLCQYLFTKRSLAMSIFVILTLYTRTDLTWKVELEKLGGHDVHY